LLRRLVNPSLVAEFGLDRSTLMQFDAPQSPPFAHALVDDDARPRP
jgi:hypothetical protein